MPSCSISPLGDGSFIQPEGMHNGLNRASIREERYHDHDQVHWLAQSFNHGSMARTKGLFADRTAIPLPLAIMNVNMARSSLASCATRRIRAKLLRRVHWRCICLHRLQHANGRLLFQAFLTFSPVSGDLPVCCLPTRYYPMSKNNRF
jgi:hypothetical protein